MDLGYRKGYFVEHLLELDRLDDLVEGLCSKGGLEVDLYSMDGLVVDLSIRLVVPILVVLLSLVEVLCSLDDLVVVLYSMDVLVVVHVRLVHLVHLVLLGLLVSKPYLLS